MALASSSSGGAAGAAGGGVLAESRAHVDFAPGRCVRRVLAALSAFKRRFSPAREQ
jgi:hypothetical protein